MEEKRGMGYLLKYIFFKPAIAFDNFKVGTAILLGFILIFSAYIFSGIVQIRTIEGLDLTDMELSDEMIEQYRDMGFSEEQIKEIEKSLDSPEYKNALNMMGRFSGVFSILGSVFAGIGISIGWLIKAGIITLIFSFMGTRPKFSESMGIIGLAWIPFFFREVFRAIMTLISGEPYVGASNMANNLDLFVLWNVILLIIGFSVNLKVSKKRAAAVLIGYWVLTMLYYYGLDQLGKLLMGGI